MRFKLYSSCIVVNGFKKSLICDLQNSVIYAIDKKIGSFILNWNNMSISEIKKNTFLNEDTINECFEFLFENDLAFIDNKTEWFNDLDLEWHYPFLISNAIIDIQDFKSYKPIFAILKELDNLKCKNVQIRFFCSVKFENLTFIMNYIDELSSIILLTEFILPDSNDLSNDKITNFLKSNSRTISLVLYDSEVNNNEVIKLKNKYSYIIKTKGSFNSIKSCGVISKEYFTINIPTFTESHHHNSCLNRKISIDVNGDIKNCPSMPESYGNIKDTTLEEAINKPGFKKYWNITKDDIEVCRDCEFRYICTDCRAYTERTKFSDEGLDLSKPLKCGYNPYTNEWAEWSTNPLKEKAIEYYGMKEIIENDKK